MEKNACTRLALSECSGAIEGTFFGIWVMLFGWHETQRKIFVTSN
jgi:hypothetical protein